MAAEKMTGCKRYSSQRLVGIAWSKSDYSLPSSSHPYLYGLRGSRLFESCLDGSARLLNQTCTWQGFLQSDWGEKVAGSRIECPAGHEKVMPVGGINT